MSNRDPDTQYDEPAKSIPWAIEQMLKLVHTAFPARIESYDAATRRASILPLIDLVRSTDGTTLPRAVIADVPVVQPHAGGLGVLMPVKVGDVVQALVNERGIERFKRTFQQSAPEGGMHAEKDAVVQLGYGPLEVTPVDDEAISIQSDDGRVSVRVSLTEGVTVTSPDGIRLEGDVTVTGSLAVDGADVTHKETDIGRTHRHIATAPGTPLQTSGPPQP